MNNNQRAIVFGVFVVGVLITLLLSQPLNIQNNVEKTTEQKVLTQQERANVDFFFAPKMISTDGEHAILFTDDGPIFLQKRH